MPVNKMIQGPVSLTHLTSEKHHMNIYLFGDVHELMSECPNQIRIDTFFMQTVEQNRDRVIDIFLEQNYGVINKERSTVVTYIDQVGKTFRNHKFPNTRVHYADLRQYHFKPMHDFLIIWFDFEERKSIKFTWKKLQKFDKKYPDFLSMLSTKKQFVQFCLNGKRVQKQLSNVDPQILQELERSVQESYYEMPALKIENVEEYMNFAILNCDRFMDVYLLGRLFRSYQNGPSAENSMIYVGNRHAQFYKTVLQNLGFQIIQTTSAKNQCLDISQFSQPFFHQKPSIHECLIL